MRTPRWWQRLLPPSHRPARTPRQPIRNSEGPRPVTLAAEQLRRLTSERDQGACYRLLTALEVMSDPAAAPILRAWIAEAPTRQLSMIHETLCALTGRDPFLPNRSAHTLRAAWACIDLATKPLPRTSDSRLNGPARATMTLHDGSGLVAFRADLPTPDQPSSPGFVSLHIAGSRAYRTGYQCGTCETHLFHVGWPPRLAATLSAALRERLAHVPRLTEDLLADITPLLGALRSGRLMITLADLDLELVTDPSSSWFNLRHNWREYDDDDEPDDNPGDDLGPGTTHFQLREPLPGEQPSFALVLPTQPLSELDETIIATHTRAIQAGLRPAAVLLTWAEDKYVQASFPERLLLSTVLDGHHKLAAYARLGIPARALLVSHMDAAYRPMSDNAHCLVDTTATITAPTG